LRFDARKSNGLLIDLLMIRGSVSFAKRSLANI
jgi:hypothetical protein